MSPVMTFPSSTTDTQSVRFQLIIEETRQDEEESIETPSKGKGDKQLSERSVCHRSVKTHVWICSPRLKTLSVKDILANPVLRGSRWMEPGVLLARGLVENSKIQLQEETVSKKKLEKARGRQPTSDLGLRVCLQG